jgi:hypothetical protein
MKTPTRQELYKLIANPEMFAHEMTLPEIDQVVYGFMSIRLDKERWSESTK